MKKPTKIVDVTHIENQTSLFVAPSDGSPLTNIPSPGALTSHATYEVKRIEIPLTLPPDTRTDQEKACDHLIAWLGEACMWGYDDAVCTWGPRPEHPKGCETCKERLKTGYAGFAFAFGVSPGHQAALENVFGFSLDGIIEVRQ